MAAATLLLLFGSLGTAAPRPVTVEIQLKGEVGQTRRYASTLQGNITVQGQKVELEDRSRSESKLISTTGGLFKYEIRTLSRESKINGEDMEMGPASGKSEMVHQPNGVLVSQKDEEDDPTSNLLSQATTVVLPTGAVSVGATWTHTYAANRSNNIVAGTFTGKLLEIGTVDGVQTAKIEGTFKASGSFEAKTVALVAVSNGDTLSSEVSIKNLVLEEGLELNATISQVQESGVSVDDATVAPPADASEDAASAAAAATEEEEEDSIDSKVEDYEKIPGLLTLYRDDADLYFEIPRSVLGQWMMLQATASVGVPDKLVAGEPLADIIFQFREIQPGKITIFVPNYINRANEGLEVNKALERSFAPSFLGTFDIEATQKSRDSVLIDVTELFKSDISGINGRFQGGGGLFGGGGDSFSPDRENTFVSGVKNFPQNLVIESTVAFETQGAPADFYFGRSPTTADPRSIVVKVNYNLFALPMDNGFVPRAYHPRVGYFTVTRFDYSDVSADDKREKMILRWDLRKKDPSAEKSEVVEPITFWLDNSIPAEFRDAVRAGVEAWNVAFEQAGFLNAVVVKQMPADAQFDHADMRYNVVRFVASPGDVYAVANFRANPLTGQILNASVTFDMNWMSYNAGEGKLFDFEGVVAARKTHNHAKGQICSACEEMARTRRTGMTMLQADPTITPSRIKEYQFQAIAHTVSHELGHIFGLRHNFIASTQLTLADMADANKVRDKGTSSSVMDYVPFNPKAIKNKDVPFYSWMPGDYDRWAIEYGYRVVPGQTMASQARQLQGLVNQANRPEFKYRSDEFADATDPYVTRFDLSREPLDFYEFMADTSRDLVMSLDRRSYPRGSSYYEFSQDFSRLVSMILNMSLMSASYLGGIEQEFMYRGMPMGRAPFRPVSGQLQRRSLAMLNKNVFSESAFDFPKRYYSFLMTDPRDDLSFAPGSDFPLRSQFGFFMSAVLGTVFSSATLDRMSNLEFKAENPSQLLTVAELFQIVGGQVWSEYATGRAVQPLRRDLQRSYVDQMIGLGIRSGSNSDSAVMAVAELKRLRTLLDGAKSRYADAGTRNHIDDLLMKINRALNAQETLGGGGGGLSLLDLLGGRKPGEAQTTGGRP